MALNAKTDPNYVPKRINGKFAPGWSGNPGGSLEATRRSFNKDFLLALSADFKRHGPQAIEKVRKTQPAAYMKICALLVPKEFKVEHSNVLKAMTDEELEQTLAALRQWIAEREGDDAKVIEGAAEPTALPEREAEAANVIEGTAEPVVLPVPGPTDEQIDAALDALREITRGVRRRGGENVITAAPVALPAPEGQSTEATPEATRKHKSNRLMREADTAVGSRERKPRMCKVPSPART